MKASPDPPDDRTQAHGSEESLIAVRRAKAEKMRLRGGDPYPNDVDVSSRWFVVDLRRRYAPALMDPAELRYDPTRFEALSADEHVQVLGRVVARRGFGKLCFLRLRDQGGEIQLFLRKNLAEAAFERLDELDVGDHLSARGPVILTKSGELSIDVRELRSLSKALRPLPEKWHGLSDVERRYRQRYVDLIANPSVAQTLRARSIVVQGLREFLDGRRFIEVETPTLHPLVGGATAQPFKTHHNALDMELFLRIAPELYLKRLLVGGLERVYEIGRCYRNEGISTRHNPEFTMLEFYQAYATYETLMDVGEQMLRHVDAYLAERFAELGWSAELEGWRSSRTFTLDEPFVRLPMRQALEAGLSKAQLDGKVLAALTENFDAEAFRDRASQLAHQSERARSIDWQNLGRGLSKCHSPGERLFVAYEYVAEPFLAEDYRSSTGTHSLPVFVTQHPTEVSPLARKNDEDPTVTDRFELFVECRELGNAFSELNDPVDQAERFRAQVAAKSRGQTETMDFDADYLRALEHGMPPAAGFGVGVDRLTMTLAGQESIRDVIAFPLLRSESAK